MDIPLIGLGTWNLRGKECTHTVKTALDMGYRHIDTAHVYENHKEIKKGLDGVDRKSLFITSKLSLDQVNLNKIEQSVEKACDLALQELGLDYLDLYLIHWPDHTKPLSSILEAIGKMMAKGKILKAGVSNFTIHHLQDVLSSKVPIYANQVEFHPYLYQKELWHFCKAHQIRLISYRPFGKGALLKDPIFNEVGEKYGKNGAQCVLRWLIQKDIPVIPKASSEPHLRENLAIFDFTLSKEDMDILDQLPYFQRFCGEGDPEFDY